MVSKSSDTESCARNDLSGYTPQDGLLASELLASLREVRFSEQGFPVNKLVTDIKYYHLGSQNNNPFHPFNNQLDYAFTTYFTESKITKDNVDKFLSNSLMALLTEKLSYQNTDEWMEKHSDIS